MDNTSWDNGDPIVVDTISTGIWQKRSNIPLAWRLIVEHLCRTFGFHANRQALMYHLSLFIYYLMEGGRVPGKQDGAVTRNEYRQNVAASVVRTGTHGQKN